MRNQTGGFTWWVVPVLAAILGLVPGCAMLNGFLDPTKVGSFPLDPTEHGIRTTLTLRETPPGMPDATDPTPADLVPHADDYRIGVGDVIGMLIHDFYAVNFPLQATVEVTPTGYIRIPELGSVKVDGLTEPELENELKARLAEAGLLPDPIVQVLVQTKRRQVYYIIGSALASGPYPLSQPDFRMLDAIGLARGITPGVKELYVIRRTSSPAPRLGAQEIPGPQGVEGLVIPPPPDEDSDAPGGFVSGFDLPLEQDVPQTQQTRERRELESIIAPGGQASQPTSRAAPPAQQRPFEPLVLDPETGQAVEARPRTRAVEPPDDRQVAAEPEPFEWEDVPEVEFEQRVIRIDAEALQNGDPRQNIVIRERDYIRVPVDNRAYYLMGEVQRPGVYGFAGREISVKQALAAAGGFGPLAWPRRCEIIRRDPGSDKELTIPVNLDAVFAGLEDDFYLRDGDILNVGTHFVAPFLFVIRNSFRFTYGFGFVYDRNFADKDAFGAQLNPEIRKAQERANRGLPF